MGHIESKIKRMSLKELELLQHAVDARFRELKRCRGVNVMLVTVKASLPEKVLVSRSRALTELKKGYIDSDDIELGIKVKQLQEQFEQEDLLESEKRLVLKDRKTAIASLEHMCSRLEVNLPDKAGQGRSPIAMWVVSRVQEVPGYDSKHNATLQLANWLAFTGELKPEDIRRSRDA